MQLWPCARLTAAILFQNLNYGHVIAIVATYQILTRDPVRQSKFVALCQTYSHV